MSDAFTTTAEPTPANDVEATLTRVYLRRAAGSTARGAWHVVIPALLTLLALHDFVPTPAESAGTWPAGFANFAYDHRLLVGLGLFIAFAAITRGFDDWLPSSAAAPRSKSGMARLLLPVAVAAVVALGVRAFVGTYEVHGGSMLPTLEPRDVALGVRAALPGKAARLSRGEIVVFERKGMDGERGTLVKRVLGLPGDRIAMQGAHVFINDWAVPTCDVGPYFYPLATSDDAVGRVAVEFLENRAYLILDAPPDRPFTGTYVVREGEAFVVGDNRRGSFDSRAWNDGKGQGLPLTDVDAVLKKWLVGDERSQRPDFAHALKPLELAIRFDGADVSELRSGIEYCLANRPMNTTPPS